MVDVSNKLFSIIKLITLRLNTHDLLDLLIIEVVYF